MELTIIVTCVFVSVLMIMRHNHKKTTETIKNLAQANVVVHEEFEAELERIRQETAKDPRTLFEKTLADFSNPSLIEDMYVTCPAKGCEEEYLRIDQPLYVCRACGKRSFRDFPMSA